MAKFSVKKPLTVFVAVIAVIVLGVVAFTNMTPDLLPNLDMPYIVIITAYPGSTPEKVEMSVTKPMEQSMATLENIENISSTSSENASTIILEFNADVNMDTITVDILQRVNQLQPYWDEMVGTPYIMKLNPSMLPVAVSAVSMDGMDTRQLSEFMNNTLMNELEGTNGVASISASGVIDEKIHVMLSQEKIDAVNRKIVAAVEDTFAENEQKLNDAEAEMNDAKAKIEDGKNQMDSMMGQAGEAGGMLAEKEVELEKGKQLINDNLAQAQSGQQQLQLVVTALEAIQQGYAELEGLPEQLAARQQVWTEIMTIVATAEAMGQPVTEEAFTPQQAEAIRAAGLDPNTITSADAQTQLTEAATQAAIVGQAVDALNQQLAGYGVTPEALDETLKEQRANLEQVNSVLANMLSARDQLNAGTLALKEAQAKINAEMTKGILQAVDGSVQMAVGESQIEMGLEELEKGREQLEDAKEGAFKQADLHNILTMDMVSQILTAQNFSMPVGYVEADGVQTMVSVGEEMTTVEDLQSLLLMDMGMDGVEPIYLTDVADIYISDNAESVYAKVDGADGVLLTYQKQSNYATAAVSDNLNAKYAELEEKYPGLHFVNMMDQGDYIYLVVDSIMQNLLLGALFAIIILFIFLKDIRPTFIVLCSIPISVIFALALMYFSGVTLNIISLSGLAVAVGMLVDNSVVVIENTYRLRALGYSAVKAAVSGASQVAGAVAASTLTTVCVFLPIVFVEGITRQLFTDMALTLGYSLVASLIVALTLVPAMSSKMLKNAKPKPDKVLDKMMAGYQKSVRWVLRHKAATMVTVTLLLVLSVLLVFQRGFAFMPGMSMPQLTVSVEMPEDSTVEETKEMADLVSARIGEIEGVETVGAMLSGGGTSGMMGGLMGGGGGTSGDAPGIDMYVLLDDAHQQAGAAITQKINESCADLDAEVITSDASSGMSLDALAGSGITLRLYGSNLQQLQQAARDTAAALEGVEGVAEVNDGIGETSPELRFVVDKNKAMAEGLTTAQVYMELSKALTTEKSSTTLVYENGEFDVLILSGSEDELTPDFVKSFKFTVTDKEGEEKTLHIRDIAQIVEGESKTSIRREEQKRYLDVSATIAEGHNVSLVNTDVQRAMNSVELPGDVELEYSGENESIMEAFGELGNMLLLGVLLVYLIMVAQFQSLKSPFIVMFTIPLAFTGGLFALVIAGMELSVIALIGFVMLVGIIVNNGIVLVDYINQLRTTGMDRREAIVEAGVTRMRPILMTTITTILGLIVMALGRGVGSELMQPIAIVCIGGLTYATILTLYVVPVMYDILNRKEIEVIHEDDLLVVEE